MFKKNTQLKLIFTVCLFQLMMLLQSKQDKEAEKLRRRNERKIHHEFSEYKAKLEKQHETEISKLLKPLDHTKKALVKVRGYACDF